MRLEFFGQYLLRHGELDAALLRETLQWMSEVNPQIGALAVQLGYATEADCRRVNDEQRRKDLPFGQLAMQMGVINAIELEELLERQREARVDLCAALIRQGHLPEDRARALYDAWKSEQQHEQGERALLPDALVGHPTAELAVALFGRMCLRVADLPVKVGAGSALGELRETVLVASVEVHGTRGLRTTLLVDPPFGEKLACGLLGMELDALAADLSLEAVAEFLNVLMGTVTTSVQELGHDAGLGAPGYGVLPSSGFVFPVVSEADGGADLVLEPLSD